MALVRRFVIALALIATTFAVAPISHADAVGGGPRINPHTGLPIGFMPTHKQAARAAAARRTAATLAPNLQYWGGPVVTSAQVQSVRWGSGTYLPEVSGAPGAVSIDTITQDMLHSEWGSGLSEFSTTNPAQTVTPGAAIGLTEITPSTAASATSIDDSLIQTELVAQINAHNLSAPTSNTIYTLYFPSGTVICDSAMGANQCSNNAFCAYHGATTATVDGIHVLYAIQPYPDATYMSGCSETVSGRPAQTPLSALEATTAHELSEVITDPLVSLAPNNAPPLGWYDLNNGEVADICQASSTGSWTWFPDYVDYLDAAGNHFSVQQYWSNTYQACAPLEPSAPRSLRATALVGGHVRLTWSAPLDDRRAPIQGYSVFEVTATNARRWAANVHGTSVTTPALPYGHGITFFVDAWNNVGGGYYGQDSNRVTVVPASTPAAVPWIRTIRGGTSPIVGWAAAPANGSAITNYLVTGPGGTRALAPTVRSFHWGYLKHGRYLVTVRAVNRLGYGTVRKFYLVN